MKNKTIKTQMANQARQRGVALVLVILAVAVAFILSLSFMNAQATNTGVARNAQNQTNARQIAESALLIALEEVRTNPSYRDTHPNGAWVTDLSLNGGQVTIVGEDGTDTDGDGIVDGDGDLTDDNSDPITLTVTATFNGATHTVRAIISDSRNVTVETIAVSDKIELKGNGSGTALIDSWNSKLGNYASTKGSNAIVSTNSTKDKKIKVEVAAEIRGDAFVGVGGNVAKGIELKSHGVITGTQGKLTNSLVIPGVAMPDIGASIGDYSLKNATDTISADVHVDKFKLEGSALLTIDGHVKIWAEGDVEIKGDAEIVILADSSLAFYTGDGKKKFKIENDAKLNVLSEDPSRLTFYRSSKEKIEIKGDSQVYGTFVMPSAELKIKDDAHVFGALRGKQLKIEKNGQFHLDLAPKFVNSDDVLIDLGGSDYGIAVEDKIEITGDARILQLGADTPRISTNSTDSDKIKFKDDSVTNGDFYVGVGGSTSTVIKDEGGTHNGTENVLIHSVDILEADEPTMPASSGNLKFSSGKTTISADTVFNKLEIEGSAILEIDKKDTNIVVNGDFKTKDTAQIQLKGSGTLNLYLKGNIEFKDSALINTVKADADKLNIFVILNDKEIKIEGNSIGFAHIHAPDSKTTMKDSITWFGTVRCNELKIENTATISVPLGIGDGQGDVGTNELKIQWIESP